MGVHPGGTAGRRSKPLKAPQLRCEYRPRGKTPGQAGTGTHRYAWAYMGSCMSATGPENQGMSHTGERLPTDPAHVHFMSYEQKSTATGFSIRENLLRHITRG